MAGNPPVAGFLDPETRYDRPQIIAKELAKADFIPIVIDAGADLVAGTAMGRITASGLYIAYLTGAADGSETCVGYLTEDADAASVDITTRLCVGGILYHGRLTGSDVAGEAEMFARRITDATGTVLLKF